MTDLDTDLLERMIDAAQADDSITKYERETGINFSTGDGRASVQTAEPALIRRLLAHPSFVPETFTQRDGDGGYIVFEADEAPEVFDGRRRLVFVAGDVDIGALKISRNARRGNSHAAIVAQHDLGETDDDA